MRLGTCTSALALLMLVGGCAEWAGLPTISAEGTVEGDDARLRSLLETIVEGLRKSPEAREDGALAHLVISVYPITHFAATAEGVMPVGNEKARIGYTMTAQGGETAQLAIVTGVLFSSDAGGTLKTGTACWRWEDGRWVSRSLGELGMGSLDQTWEVHTDPGR